MQMTQILDHQGHERFVNFPLQTDALTRSQSHWWLIFPVEGVHRLYSFCHLIFEREAHSLAIMIWPPHNCLDGHLPSQDGTVLLLLDSYYPNFWRSHMPPVPSALLHLPSETD